MVDSAVWRLVKAGMEAAERGAEAAEVAERAKLYFSAGTFSPLHFDSTTRSLSFHRYCRRGATATAAAPSGRWKRAASEYGIASLPQDAAGAGRWYYSAQITPTLFLLCGESSCFYN
ncbi:Protein of unknown function [Gryllus bimaculatus]|nr:Protein of unknown function [Gryllus bimaculatus]